MTDPIHCKDCGYTEEDAKIQMDHHLCKNAGNAPWETNASVKVNELVAKRNQRKRYKNGQTKRNLISLSF